MMIEAEFKMLKTSITNVLNIIEGLTNLQMNEIPKGFSNNIIWNVAHLSVTQKLLIYGLSNNDLNLPEEFVSHFRKGTKPQHYLSNDEINFVKDELLKFPTQLKQDILNQKFKNYKAYPTSYNFEITNFNEALVMVNLHYGLHFSTILRLLKKM
ncbi:MAG TPA: DinB family protein [Crocinitomix sp.]|nr:DinB family protein [Crocinitomix sp.]